VDHPPGKHVSPPAPTRRSARDLLAIGGAVAVAALLIVQAGFFASSQLDAFAQSRSVRDAARTEMPPSWGNVPLAVFEELEALDPQIPAAARVLLVSDATLPVAYDFPLLPRPLRLLFDVDKLRAGSGQLPPAAGKAIRDGIAELERHGQILGPESLREQLSAADCLVTVFVDVDTLPWPPDAPAPQLLGRVGVTAAYSLRSPSR
jgi:hypothetical protein